MTVTHITYFICWVFFFFYSHVILLLLFLTTKQAYFGKVRNSESSRLHKHFKKS